MNKIKLALLALAMPVVALAQGWPANYGGVMLQGFYWDSFVDSQWSNLESQADELSCFKLIWVPQSGNCNSSYNQMGYTPVYFFDHNSSFGTEKQLRSMISTFKAKGTGIIQDVVINHHNNLGVNGSWVDFPAETYNGVTYQFKSTDICANDDGGKTKKWASENGFNLSANNDTGEGWDGCRDLDHKSANVQKIVNAYLPYLLNDLGYAGFRYDMVKGYSASFTGQYNTKAGVQYSVGEYWDGNASTVINWINGTKVNNVIQSAAFDFPFRYNVRDAVNGSDWSKLGNASVMSNASYKRYAVTFIENHDTEYRSSAEQQDPIRKDTIAANAFLIAMPGTPCVFYKHWQDYKSEIKNMIELRQIAGIHNMSSYSKYRSNVNYFANQVTGTKGKLMVVVGKTELVKPSAASWVEVIAGHHYKYYLSPSCEVAWADVASGEYEKAFEVRLVAVSATSGAKLVYTLDGSNPTASSPQVENGTKITISGSCTLKVGLLKNGAVSSVLSRDYQIVPFTPHTATVHVKDPNQKLAGADISLLDRYEQRGAIYYDKNGTKVTDMLAFYKQIGLNAMRVRLFVDPSKASDADKGQGVFQDIAYVKALGKRIKDHGLKFILDFHYSDSWADPGKQTVPSRWAGLSVEAMTDSVYSYTKASLEAMVAAGVRPDYVQVGNEITYGMLWPTGSVWPEGTANKGTWANFSAYFNAGARAVREVLPNAKVICHIEMSNNGNPGKFFGMGAKKFGLDYDIMGLSYYPAYHATASTVISALEGVIKQLKVQVPDRKIMIMETGYSYRWEMSGTKDTNISKKYTYTEAGQAKFVADLVTMLNKYSESVNGLFWWCAEQNEYGLDWNTQRVVDSWWQASLVDNENGKILQATYELPTFK